MVLLLHFNAKTYLPACLNTGRRFLAQNQILICLLFLLALNDKGGALLFESASILDDLETLFREATLGID